MTIQTSRKYIKIYLPLFGNRYWPLTDAHIESIIKAVF